MPTRAELREVPRSLVVRPRTPAPFPAVADDRHVIDVDLRRQVPSVRGAALAREAASRYGAHGTDLLGPGHHPATVEDHHGPADGWALVARWLGLVAVLAVVAVAFAALGNATVG